MTDYTIDPGVTINRLIAERDAALADVERLDNALNVTDAAAEKWLSDRTKARELFELILDDPRLVVAMSSDILVPIKFLLAGKPEPFESKVSALQQRLTAADELSEESKKERDAICENYELLQKRVDLLEKLLAKYYSRSDVCAFKAKDIAAALKPAEGLDRRDMAAKVHLMKREGGGDE